jgi:hypothetical protein
VVDDSGYFPAGSPLTPMKPQRLLDTRQTAGKPSAGSDTVVQLPAGAAAGALMVTVTQPATRGWVSAYPCGTPWPGTSSVNFAAGQTIAGSAIVKAGTDRKVCVRASTGTHLVVDLMGTIDGSGEFTAIDPRRLADTRTNPGARLQPFTELAVPANPAAPAVVLNLTTTGSTGPGWVQAYPCGTKPALTSNLNFTAGQTIANAAIVKTGANGKICLRSTTATHLVIDQNAAFGTTAYIPEPPRRLTDTRNP